MDRKNKNYARRPVSKSSASMIYGIRAIIEALDAGHDLEKIFIQKNLKGELIKELTTKVANIVIPVSKVPIEKLNRLTRKNHQGAVAFLSPVKYHDLANLIVKTFEDGEVPFFLILDRVTDVRNFGAIARSAEACGVHGVLIPSTNAAQINADAMKTSAGALASLPVCRVDHLPNAVKYLKESGCKIIASTEKGSIPIDRHQMIEPVALILGSEEDGISREVMDLVDVHVQIPMKGKIASLNVSAAAAICLYEITRQRG